MIGQGINLQTLSGQLLDAVVQHWAGVDPQLPARRFVAAGEPRTIAWDCEQVFVSLAGIGLGPAADSSMPAMNPPTVVSAMAIRHAVLTVSLVRCTPSRSDGKQVDADILDAAGRVFMHEAGLLSQALIEFAAELRQGLSRELQVLPGLVEPVGPEGGFHGLEAALSLTAMRLE